MPEIEAMQMRHNPAIVTVALILAISACSAPVRAEEPAENRREAEAAPGKHPMLDKSAALAHRAIDATNRGLGKAADVVAAKTGPAVQQAEEQSKGLWSRGKTWTREKWANFKDWWASGFGKQEKNTK